MKPAAIFFLILIVTGAAFGTIIWMQEPEHCRPEPDPVHRDDR